MPFNIKKKLYQGFIASTSLVIVSSILWGMNPALAQKVISKTIVSQASEQNISNSELQQFARIIEQVITIDQQTTQQIVQVIQEEGMTVDRFNAIVKWKKDQETPNPSVTDQEMESFQKVVTKIAQVQEQADGKLKEVFQSQELEVGRFNQILEAVREDPNLQNQVQQILEK